MHPKAGDALVDRSIPPSHTLEQDEGSGCWERFEIRAVVTASAGVAGTVATEGELEAAGVDAFPPTGATPGSRRASPAGDAAAPPTSGAGYSPEMASLVNNCRPPLLHLGGKTAPRIARVGTNSVPLAEEVALTEEAPWLPAMGAAMMGAPAAAAAEGEEAAVEKTATAAISSSLVQMASWSATVLQSATGVMSIDAAPRHAPKEEKEEGEEEVEAVEPQAAGRMTTLAAERRAPKVGKEETEEEEEAAAVALCCDQTEPVVHEAERVRRQFVVSTMDAASKSEVSSVG